MVTEHDVRTIAHLARIYLEQDDVPRFTHDFNRILTYVEKLKELDVDQTEPMSHVHGFTNVLREDRVLPGLKTSEVLKNAPETTGECFICPLIIETDHNE